MQIVIDIDVDVLTRLFDNGAEDYAIANDDLFAIAKAIRKGTPLPKGYRLEQEPKTGYWIDTGSGQQCSECGEIQYGYDNYRRYCAYCGAKMEEVGR